MSPLGKVGRARACVGVAPEPRSCCSPGGAGHRAGRASEEVRAGRAEHSPGPCRLTSGGRPCGQACLSCSATSPNAPSRPPPRASCVVQSCLRDPSFRTHPGPGQRLTRLSVDLAVVDVYTRPVQKTSAMSVKIETATEDTGNAAHGTMTPQSPSKWAPWDLAQVSQWPSAAPSKSLPFQR